MEGFFQLLQTQGTMMLYLAVGLFCRKRGILNEASEKSLAATIMSIVLPCTIFCAMLDGLGQVDWKSAGTALVVSFYLLLTSYCFGRLVFRKYPDAKKSSLIFGTLINNAAFVGLPMVSSIFGISGIFYTTVYMTVSRLFMWSLGVSLFPDHQRKNPMIAVLTNPNTIAMFLALAVYFYLPFQLPFFFISAIRGIGSTSTVLCMVMVGSLLNGISGSDLLDPAVLHFCAIRLLVLPLCVFCVLKLLGLDAEITGILTLLASAPAPTTGSVFATQYHADQRFASALVLVSTALSMLTVPLLSLLYS